MEDYGKLFTVINTKAVRVQSPALNKAFYNREHKGTSQLLTIKLGRQITHLIRCIEHGKCQRPQQ